jgi:arylsulfatase A
MILTHSPFVPTPDSAAWNNDRRLKQNRFFGDMVETMDRLVGEIVAKLDDLGVRQETLILFTGDNGTHGSITSLMDDGREIRGGKGYPSDAGTRVPLIANWPGRIPPGQVRDELIDTTDFPPTIADAAGAGLPTPPGDGIIDGRSFLPQLLGQPSRPRDWVFVGYLEPRQDGFGWPRARFVRDRRYKLYDTYLRMDRKSKQVVEDKSGHLYDVSNDPAEEHPIVASDDTPETAAARKRLKAVLDRLQPPSDWKALGFIAEHALVNKAE